LRLKVGGLGAFDALILAHLETRQPRRWHKEFLPYEAFGDPQLPYAFVLYGQRYRHCTERFNRNNCRTSGRSSRRRCPQCKSNSHQELEVGNCYAPAQIDHGLAKGQAVTLFIGGAAKF